MDHFNESLRRQVSLERGDLTAEMHEGRVDVFSGGECIAKMIYSSKEFNIPYIHKEEVASGWGRRRKFGLGRSNRFGVEDAADHIETREVELELNVEVTIPQFSYVMIGRKRLDFDENMPIEMYRLACDIAPFGVHLAKTVGDDFKSVLAAEGIAYKGYRRGACEVYLSHDECISICDYPSNNDPQGAVDHEFTVEIAKDDLFEGLCEKADEYIADILDADIEDWGDYSLVFDDSTVVTYRMSEDFSPSTAVYPSDTKVKIDEVVSGILHHNTVKPSPQLSR